MPNESLGMTIAALVVAVACMALLIAALVQIRDMKVAIADLGARLKAPPLRPGTAQLPPALEERLDAIEDAVRNLPAAYDRLERAGRSDRTHGPGAPTPTRSPPRPVEVGTGVSPPLTNHRPEEAPSPMVAAPRQSAIPVSGSENPVASDHGTTRSATPNELIETYRELVARPRKAEIARWFDDLGGLPCEVSDDNVFQLIGRGDGARLMLVPLNDRIAMILPSALMVVDFATSFSDTLTARSAVRKAFELDADGSGMLRLIQPASAIMTDGSWQLKTPGRLGGLANG